MNLIQKINAGLPAFVAVYGTLKKRGNNHRVMGESRLIGEAVVPGFDMFKLGGFPGVRPGDGSVLVEVYQVTNTTDARRIYSLEGYNGIRGDSDNTFYDTQGIDVQIGGHNFESEIFIYQGRCDPKQKVEDGVW